jgi:hypothetical protein
MRFKYSEQTISIREGGREGGREEFENNQKH